MAKKLYVGNLSYDTDEASLKNFFGQAGSVSEASIIMNRATGRSKGFGFVEMATEEEAQKAIDTLNGQELDGRNIVVEEARPMQPRPQRRSFGRGGFNR